MLFSTVLTWLLIALAFVIALPALWLFAQGFWPEKVARLQEVAGRGLLKSFFIGLVPLAGGIFFVAVLSKLPQMGAVAVLVGGLLLTWGFLGAAGMAARVGERLWPRAEPWCQMKQGGLTLVCCALLPVVGWVVLLPLIAILGWGMEVRSWFIRQPGGQEGTTENAARL
ncbi:MAG: hypothetical protein LDL31_00405 [Prosthecobacter sp.]|jgi:hypothetical protein|nr:hypothetical protein [Prosthecobacter sp.]